MPALPSPVANYTFASDNTAGVCPEAWAALADANTGCEPSYGDDRLTARARQQFCELFETDCDVFLVFNGTAANALALTACCRSPHTRILCHAHSHVDTDECAAPEFFTGGAKVTPLPGPRCKLALDEVRRALHRGHGVHYPKPGALSLTQSTEWGTVYTPDEIKSLAAIAHEHGLSVHMDGSRFANACAALSTSDAALPGNAQAKSKTPAAITWRAGVDVLSFGGTKNGMLSTEAVVFFNHDLAREFDYRVKQGGQLASKMRFASAQWVAMLQDGAWLRNATHANTLARRLSNELLSLPQLRPVVETEVNGVFVEMPLSIYSALEARGWRLHRFIGEDGYRLMCSWATTAADVDAFINDVRELVVSAS